MNLSLHLVSMSLCNILRIQVLHIALQIHKMFDIRSTTKLSTGTLSAHLFIKKKGKKEKKIYKIS